MAEQAFTPLSNTETAAFCSQMAMILHSGISTLEGVSLMLEDTKDQEEIKFLTCIEETLQSTGNFQEALASTGAFPAYMLHMVQIGEYSGKLDEVMEALSVHYEREAGIAQAIKNAVTYPLIMVFMMLLVILVLVTKVMPIFNQVFRQLGSEMTGLSKAILDFGTAINRYSVVLIVLVALLAVLILYFGKTKSGREKLSSFTSRLGWTKAFTEKLAACRFASGMSLTLSSGMNPEECLNLASKLTNNEEFTKNWKPAGRLSTTARISPIPCWRRGFSPASMPAWFPLAPRPEALMKSCMKSPTNTRMRLTSASPI